VKQAHEGKECVSVAGVLKAVNFLRPGYHYEHDTVFKEMHRRAPPVTGIYMCVNIRYISKYNRYNSKYTVTRLYMYM
jgi:hypothetical protein